MNMEFLSDLFLFSDGSFPLFSELHKILASICVGGVFLSQTAALKLPLRGLILITGAPSIAQAYY